MDSRLDRQFPSVAEIERAALKRLPRLHRHVERSDVRHASRLAHLGARHGGHRRRRDRGRRPRIAELITPFRSPFGRHGAAV